MKGVKIIITIFLLRFPFVCFAGEGTTTANFLKFSYSARQSSLAGAYSAIGDDSNAIFSNPAGIIDAENKQLGVGFVNYLLDSKSGFISYKTQAKNSDIAFGVIGFEVDSIDKRTKDYEGIVPSEGSFNSTDMSFLFAYAKKDFASSLLDNLNAGFVFKFINSKIDSSSAQSIAFDLGFLYRYSSNINISFVLSNLGTKMKYEQESDNIPLSLKAGFLYKIDKKANIVAEVEEFIYDEKFYPSIGAEWYLKESFVLRGGYRFGYDTSNLGSMVGFAAGFGIITKEVGFNYAYVPFGDLGNINRFDIQLKF
ncbi:MAG: PorV/PorQ family protein [Elusimicrobiota bacterium]